MEHIELKKGNLKTNSRDVYWIKSYIHLNLPENLLVKLIVVASHEYITGTLGINSEKDEVINKFLNDETEKTFEEFKMNPEKFNEVIIKSFPNNSIPDIENFIEEA